MRKHFLFSSALLMGAFLIAAPVSAAEFKSGEVVHVGPTETVKGDLFAASANLSVDANVPGDAFLAGSIVRVTGNVGQSLYAAGSMVNITGNVGHAVRVAGGQVFLSGTIEGDVIVAGGVVDILPNTVIKGDLYAGAGSIMVEGKVQGSVIGGGGNVALLGEIGKDVKIDAEELTLGPQARIAGNLSYRATKEASLSEGAVVSGVTDFKMIERQERNMKFAKNKAFPIAAVASFLFAFLLLNIGISFLGNYFFKQRVADITQSVLSDFAKQTGMGFVWLAVLPIACVILCVTIIGIPIGLFGFTLYVLVTGLAKVMAGIILGAWIMKYFVKKRGWRVDWKAIVLGQVLITLALFVPIVGWIFAFVFTIAALGGIMTALRPVMK